MHKALHIPNTLSWTHFSGHYSHVSALKEEYYLYIHTCQQLIKFSKASSLETLLSIRLSTLRYFLALQIQRHGNCQNSTENIFKFYNKLESKRLTNFLDFFYKTRKGRRKNESLGYRNLQNLSSVPLYLLDKN